MNIIVFDSGIEQPKDRGLLIKDISEDDGEGMINNYGKMQISNEKANCIDANYHKGLDNHGQRTVIKTNRASAKCELRRIANRKDVNEKANCLQASSWKGEAANGTTIISVDNITWRKLTPLECERLQTFPDGYTEGISNTQRYKCLGNSWTVDVIAHIFSYLNKGE